VQTAVGLKEVQALVMVVAAVLVVQTVQTENQIVQVAQQ
jgi:hypothetical protein